MTDNTEQAIPKGGVFVKCSHRLPNTTVFAREFDFRGTITPFKGGIIWTHKYESIPIECYEDIEWLDESTNLLPGQISVEYIPNDDMRKIYNTVSGWNAEILPYMLKGMVQGYLLAVGKLAPFRYLTDKELSDFIQSHGYKPDFLAEKESAEIAQLKKEIRVYRQALELAECELKALYPRLGFKGSNILNAVSSALGSYPSPKTDKDNG